MGTDEGVRLCGMCCESGGRGERTQGERGNRVGEGALVERIGLLHLVVVLDSLVRRKQISWNAQAQPVVVC